MLTKSTELHFAATYIRSTYIRIEQALLWFVAVY
jgi:hypothetical protein